MEADRTVFVKCKLECNHNSSQSQKNLQCCRKFSHHVAALRRQW
eukprot:gene10395-19206_t